MICQLLDSARDCESVKAKIRDTTVEYHCGNGMAAAGLAVLAGDDDEFTADPAFEARLAAGDDIDCLPLLDSALILIGVPVRFTGIDELWPEPGFAVVALLGIATLLLPLRADSSGCCEDVDNADVDVEAAV